MLRKVHERFHSDEKGFTLMELLVVILIIGILAAIALPAFLSQRSMGQDADAKSQARSLVSHLEGFYATEQTYAGAAASKDVAGSGIPVGAGKGQSSITSDAATYSIVAYSESGAKFTIAKAADGWVNRSCDKKGDGACPTSGNW